MGKSGRVLNLGNDHDIRDLERELGDDFVLVKATNTFAETKQTTSKKQPAAVKSTEQTTGQTATQAAKQAAQRQPVQAKPVPVVEKPKKKKRLKATKDKGKPKWAKKSAD